MKKKTKIIIAISSLLGAIIIALSIFLFAFYLPNKQKEKERMELVRQYRANKLSKYEEENNQYADYEVDVAFLGDSLTDGCDVNLYYPSYVVTNRGIGGDTTYDVIDRLQVSVYDLKPKVVVLLIGGNNLNTMFDNYEDILEGFKENLPFTKVVLVSLSAMGRDWAYKNEIAAFNNVKIKLLAEKYNYYYVDIFTPLFNIETGEIYSEYTVDGAHFTHEGYVVVTERINAALVTLLGH